MTTDRWTTADVVVLGGGIAGTATAVELAARGRRVVLLERAELAAGASGRNSGVVQHPYDPVLVELHLSTIDAYRTLAEHGDGSFRLPPEPAGLLSLTHDPAVAAHEAATITATLPQLDATVVGPPELRELEPALRDDVWACRLRIGYPVAPWAATRAMAARAAALGVDVRVDAGEARPWLDGDGRALGARLADGSTVAAPDVVIAAGPWSPALVDPTGAWRPIIPLWGVVVTVALPQAPRHVLEEATSDIPLGAEAAAEPGHSFSLVTADGASSLGSTFLPDEPDPASVVAGLVERGATFVPAVETALLGAVRACARPLALDGRPLVGRVPGRDGLWIHAGHGPWGISTAPASARILADVLTGTAAAPPATLDPARFGPLPPPRSG